MREHTSVAPAREEGCRKSAAASYAAREVVEELLGNPRVPMTLANAAMPEIGLEYSDFEEITDDIDNARIYGGIHFRFDQRAGARQGRKVASWILAHTMKRARPAR
jgi:hypothetical protein